MAMCISRSSVRPCLDIYIYRKKGILLLFANGATCRQAVFRANPSVMFPAVGLKIKGRRDLRFQTLADSIIIQGEIKKFRRKHRQNRQRELQSILMRSLLFFASQQNYFIDFFVNYLSENAKVVLKADSDGGQGGGFRFLPGLGGSGDENYYGRKSSEKLWWGILSTACVFSLVFFIGIYSGILKIDYNSVKRLKELAIQAGSHGSLILLLFFIVASLTFTWSIFVGFLRSLIKNSKVTLFPPRTHNTRSTRCLTARTVFWAAGIGIIYPIIHRAEGMYCLGQLQQTMGGRMKAALVGLSIHFGRVHSLCQKKLEELIKSAATREANARHRGKGRAKNRRKGWPS